MNCKICNIALVTNEESKGICQKCLNNLSQDELDALERKEAAALAAIDITTETAFTQQIQRLGFVASEYVIGLNIFKDALSQLTDIAGGRSKTLETAMQTAREHVLNDLRKQAQARGANAVIAVNISYNELKGNQMLFIAANGTAARI